MHSLPPGEEGAPVSAAGAQSQLSHVQASHARQHERRWHCSHTCVITVMIAAAEHRAICTALPVGCKFPCYGPQLTLKLAMLWLGASGSMLLSRHCLVITYQLCKGCSSRAGCLLLNLPAHHLCLLLPPAAALIQGLPASPARLHTAFCCCCH